MKKSPICAPIWSNSLTKAFEIELNRSQQKVREAITPYARFVRTESEKLLGAREQFSSIKTELERLKKEIDTLDFLISRPINSLTSN